MEMLAESFAALNSAVSALNESLEDIYWAFAEAGMCPIFCEGTAVELLGDGSD